MSAFALLIPPGALTSRPSQAYRTLRYRVPLADHTLSFGSWLEPRYIFGAGTLGLSATLSFTVFVVTHVSIRTSDASRSPHGSPLISLRNAPLPLVLRRTQSFGSWLEPRYIFGAETLV